jgi:hypothetical protein
MNKKSDTPITDAILEIIGDARPCTVWMPKDQAEAMAKSLGKTLTELGINVFVADETQNIFEVEDENT